MCAEDAVLSTNLKKIINEVNTIYLEIDLDNAGELLSGILALGMKGGQSLHDIVSKDEYDRVKLFFENLQGPLPFELLEKQPPLLISSSLYELLLPCKQKNGMEVKIIDEAYKAKKETKGLETVAFQTSILDSIPYKDQARDLVNTIDSLGKYQKGLEEMLEVYKAQDIHKLYELAAREESGTTEYMDMLLYKRNRNWISQFPSIANNASILFAVGAGHLGGEKGVINLLQQHGYTVRPIVN